MKTAPSKRQAREQLAAFFERNGYVRLQNTARLSAEGAQRYKKGNEVRLTANSEAELVQIQELLSVLGFTPGRPFAKGNQFRIPIYGREQISRFLALVGKHH
ncbi:MAG TPA: LAGLIDADG family homing endonuclease [Xanthomonadaceae bacterium]|nr:LAGLIDADG family homing endonuclease [Xanthomonadaceae bacterium]